MTWDAGSIQSTTPWADLSTKLKTMCGAAGAENWSFVENIPAGTSVGQSGSASYSIDLFQCKGSNTVKVPVTAVNKLSTGVTTDGTQFTLNAGTLVPDRVYLLTVINTKASAADQPSGVAFHGTNVPQFQLVKTQAGGNAGEIRTTVYLARSHAAGTTVLPTSIDTATGLPPFDDDELYSGLATPRANLTINFGANTQTGCIVILEEFSGLDMGAYDSTGSTGLVVQAVGGSGTTETAHTAPMAAFQDGDSIAYVVAGEANGTGNYTNGSEWYPTSADITFATPTTHARAMMNPDVVDATGTLTLSAATSETSWACVSLELQRQTPQTSTATVLNDAGKNFYLIFERPVTDGAVVNSIMAAEEYEPGQKIFGGLATANALTQPSGSRYWGSSGYDIYANVTATNRATSLMGGLNITGFQYWIKLTKNMAVISVRVSGTESSAVVGLLDSFVSNATDSMPLVCSIADTASELVGSSFSSLPGVVTMANGTSSRAWQAAYTAWTHNVLAGGAPEGGSLFNNTAATQVDLWASSKAYVSRIVCWHGYGQTVVAGASSGFYRGLVKSDFLCIAAGGTVQLGDTIVVSGITWTVIKFAGAVGTSAQSMAWLTRAT